MKGSGKIYQSLAPELKNKTSIKYLPKPKRTFKVKQFLKQKKFKTLKRKIEKEINNSDIGQLKSYKLCLAFIEKFLEKYETVMNSGNAENAEKESNYSLFATMLAIALSQVNEEYEDIVNESELINNNNNTMNNLIKNPYDYLEKYIEYIEDEDVIEDYEKVIDKYFNSFNKNQMKNNNNNNNNSEQEYIAYSGFIRDSVEALKGTIKKYSNELKSKKKIANNVNIDDLIMGLTAIKIKGFPNSIKTPNSIKNNQVLTNDFLNKFMKLGL
jgi:hypothetical protein